MIRTRFLIGCGLVAVVWLAAFGFHYYAIAHGCWFPAPSLSRGGYICTDPLQGQVAPIAGENLAVLTPTSAVIIEIAAIHATGNTVIIAIFAVLAGAVIFGAIVSLRKLWRYY